MRRDDDSSFRWIPGRGPDVAALGRLRAQWPRRPPAPMGEAWFMGESRKMFPQLMGNLDAVPAAEIEHALREAASGTISFGLNDEWSGWFHYLLPQLVPRALETGSDSLLELLVDGLLAHYPQGVVEPPYPGFREDILATLGQCLPGAWDETTGMESAQRPPHSYPEVTGTFAASAFLMLKYLPGQAVAEWVTSLLDIPFPPWRAQVLTWLVGIHGRIDRQGAWPRYWTSDEPQVAWGWSHIHSGFNDGDHSPRPPAHPPIPDANRDALFATARRRMSVERLCAWLDSFAPYAGLHDSQYDLPERFTRLYLD